MRYNLPKYINMKATMPVVAIAIIRAARVVGTDLSVSCSAFIAEESSSCGWGGFDSAEPDHQPSGSARCVNAALFREPCRLSLPWAYACVAFCAAANTSRADVVPGMC